jgi:hypothetical protein
MSAVWVKAVALAERTSVDVTKSVESTASNRITSTGDQSELPAEFVEEMRELMENASPSAVIVTCDSRLGQALHSLLQGAGATDIDGLNTARLGERAFHAHLIDVNVFDSIKGLSVMSLLAAMEQDDLDPKKAEEFAVYAAATLYTIERARTVRTP